MRALLRRIAGAIGMRTWYHVAATYPLGGGGFATLSCVCGMHPWLHHENYQALVDYVKAQSKDADVTPNIVSITRLGA